MSALSTTLPAPPEPQRGAGPAWDSQGVWTPPDLPALMQAVGGQQVQPATQATRLQSIGRSARAAVTQGVDLLRFVGTIARNAVAVLPHPARWRTRSVWHEIQLGGADALPIIGLTTFLLGVVVAYQGADQLRHYGANIFVVDLVGYAMLREFAPLISAIIIAGRSGSSYAAQLGTMVVSEEIDALRTIGIEPHQRLVLPKLLALAVALPLLTVFGDIAGVFGGMVMARATLDIGFAEFIDRFSTVMQGSTLLLGVGKSLVFALVIATVGCFQGLRTHGSADSVGRQTTVSVVQGIFLVIVADALFSVAFNALDL
jgi:phospholipid/cholesterol/gamma-HCH transport system permease protein